MSTDTTEKDNLKDKLKEKMQLLKLKRSTKRSRDTFVDNKLKNIGIDKEKLKNDMEQIKKQGGLTFDLKN
jgi:hypothetical protein